MFGISGEHLLILAGILLIFGPKKLPELGSSVGKALKNFKEGLNSPSSSGQLEVVQRKELPANETSQEPVAQTNSGQGGSAPKNPPSA